jgi:hypothetical protein
MATPRQELGNRGERLVARLCSCPRCKRLGTLRQLRANFKCADIICDFCGFLAQVKTSTRSDVESLPNTVLGAAWGPMRERLDAGLYFPLFLVLVAPNGRDRSIWYLSADHQEEKMFVPRKPLSSGAKRAGWQGFKYEIDEEMKSRFTRIS